MEYEFFTTVPKQVLDMKPLAEMVGYLNSRCVMENLRKSIRMFFKSVQVSDQHRDNFIRNEVTIVLSYNGYKIPRIVKRRLLNPQVFYPVSQ